LNPILQRAITIAALNPKWNDAYAWTRILSPLRSARCEVIQINPGDSLDVMKEVDFVLIGQEFPAEAPRAYDEARQRAIEFKKQVVYDVNEAVFALDESHPNFDRYKGRRLSILRAICEADAVLASTSNLAQECKNFNAHILTGPSYIDPFIWTTDLSNFPRSASAGSGEESIVIGYVGSEADQQDIASIEPALHAILRDNPNSVMLKLWGTPPTPALRALPNVRYIGSYPDDYRPYAKYMAANRPDIFISPLALTRFNQSTSPIRYLEQSVLGAPGIYGRFGPYEEVVFEGVDGLMAGNLDEWHEALQAMITSDFLRRSLGQAARGKVLKDWIVMDRAVEIRAAFEPLLNFRNASNLARQRVGALHVIDSYAQYVNEMEAEKLELKAQSKELTCDLASARYKLQSQVEALRTQIQLEQDLRIATEEKNEKLLKKIAELEDSIQNMSGSRAWKVTRFITESVRSFGV